MDQPGSSPSTFKAGYGLQLSSYPVRAAARVDLLPACLGPLHLVRQGLLARLLVQRPRRLIRTVHPRLSTVSQDESRVSQSSSPSFMFGCGRPPAAARLVFAGRTWYVAPSQDSRLCMPHQVEIAPLYVAPHHQLGAVTPRSTASWVLGYACRLTLSEPLLVSTSCLLVLGRFTLYARPCLLASSSSVRTASSALSTTAWHSHHMTKLGSAKAAHTIFNNLRRGTVHLHQTYKRREPSMANATPAGLGGGQDMAPYHPLRPTQVGLGRRSHDKSQHRHEGERRARHHPGVSTAPRQLPTHEWLKAQRESTASPVTKRCSEKALGTARCQLSGLRVQARKGGLCTSCPGGPWSLDSPLTATAVCLGGGPQIERPRPPSCL
jgi:hypothetical protein